MQNHEEMTERETAIPIRSKTKFLHNGKKNGKNIDSGKFNIHLKENKYRINFCKSLLSQAFFLIYHYCFINILLNNICFTNFK